MDDNVLKEILEKGLPDCEVTVKGDGSHFNLLVLGECFAGLSTLKKQQKVYGVINHLIAEGTVHAVNIKAMTAAQWSEQQG
jgi:acid stress-induced BolA-like protein IbaG/YrbA